MDVLDEISTCRSVVTNFGGEVAHIARLSGGEVNSVFAVDLSSGVRVVVRLHRRTDDYAPTVKTLYALKGIGLPVPFVAARGTSRIVRIYASRLGGADAAGKARSS